MRASGPCVSFLSHVFIFIVKPFAIVVIWGLFLSEAFRVDKEAERSRVSPAFLPCDVTVALKGFLQKLV